MDTEKNNGLGGNANKNREQQERGARYAAPYVFYIGARVQNITPSLRKDSEGG